MVALFWHARDPGEHPDQTNQHSCADLFAENQSRLILSSRFVLLNVILKNIFGTLECDSQKHILIL